tara:strand:- start:398 stop:769 length:372 start_codon:yes stop_codon:yes gene_type:complete
MKKYLMIILALASFEATAGDVRLFCEGFGGWNGDEFVTGNVILNEDAGEMKYARFSNQKYKEVKKVKFSEEYVSGSISGDMDSKFLPIKIELNRYTGVVTTKAPGVEPRDTLQCKKTAREKLF